MDTNAACEIQEKVESNDYVGQITPYKRFDLKKLPKQNLIYDHTILATIESTRTILGVVQSPMNSTKKQLSIIQPSFTINERDEVLKTNQQLMYSNNSLSNSVINSENINPESLSKISHNTTKEYDTEHTRRIVCKKTIESLQEKILELEQENAVLKLENHKKEMKIRSLKDTLDQVKVSWENTEVYLSSISRQNELLQTDLQQHKLLNLEITEALSDCKLQNENLMKSEKKAKDNYKESVQKLEIEMKNMQCQLQTQDQCVNQYQKDIPSYQKELFILQKEKQDLMRSKVKIETDMDEKISQLKLKLAEVERYNCDCKAIIDKQQTQIDTLRNTNESLTREIDNVTSLKSSLEAEFRKSEANVIVRDVENLVMLKKTLSEKESEFEELRKKLAALKSEEIENLKLQYESTIQEIRNLHKVQIEEVLRKIKETEVSKENCLETANKELIRAKNKIDKLETGRNRILSRLQVNLQNQWKESIQLLYSDEDSATNFTGSCEREPVMLNSKVDWLQSPNLLFNSPFLLEKCLTSEHSQPLPNSAENIFLRDEIPHRDTVFDVYDTEKDIPCVNVESTPKMTNSIDNRGSNVSSNSEKIQFYIKKLLQEKVTTPTENQSPPVKINLSESLEDRTEKFELSEIPKFKSNNLVIPAKQKTEEKSPPWK